MQNFMLTPNPSKKYQKNSGEQSYQQKSDIKMKFLTFYYFMQKFSDYNFYWVNFFAFVSTYLISAFYDTHI
jgi:hypothetical protein